MSLFDQAKKLPLNPGVYLFTDKKGEVLYVGRATSLRRRVLSYFQKDLEPRIAEMVGLAKKIEFRKTDSVLEAIILEANLIKKYWPKYNIKEKDDRSFVYIVFGGDKDFPRPLIIRGREFGNLPPAKHIFGPYQSLALVKNALRIIRRIFPYSLCKPLSGKPCFDYQIGLCPGACLGEISPQEYKKNIKNITLLLAGRKKQLLKKLKKANPTAFKSLKQIEDASLVSRDETENDFDSAFYRVEAYDVSHFAGKETVGAMVVFINNQPDKTQYRLFKIKTALPNDDLSALEEMISRRFRHQEWLKPNLLLVDGGLPQVRKVSQTLKKLTIAVPVAGISKYQNDKLIFPSGLDKTLKIAIENLKGTLLKARNEAHRFSNAYRKKLLNRSQR
ncbi:MAG: GIY-YIG nuclease family protein [Candidatus Paceibacterota bacterium]|jgi:excinuclease ABC subunit C|nr:GIY-YIG nuclease family protein [Candidatus Paceibacterota bacterium]MDD4998910.1 GIY-YIG nuclease family protein [Candidatus Paceibacterota bacterium]MDD5545451.1 GIY-YIG nuclease family protein [Candidatus Paceibacterota bacterium]